MAAKYLRGSSGLEFVAEGYLDESADQQDPSLESALFYVDQETGIMYIREPGVDDDDDTWAPQGQLVKTYALDPEDVGTASPGSADALASRGDHVHGHGSQGDLASAHNAVGIDIADSAGNFDAGDVEAALAEIADTLAAPSVLQVPIDQGTVSYDDGGDPVGVTLLSVWGYDGTPYFDDEDGAAEGEEASLWYDLSAGVYFLQTYDF